MPLNIFSSNKKSGVHTNRIDKEDYFDRWESCVPIGSADQPELIGQPCYKHKACGHLTKVPHDRIPPVICQWCGVDTIKEQKKIKKMERSGVAVLDFPQAVVNLKRETFDLKRIAGYLRGH